jgi:hypothetical protein
MGMQVLERDLAMFGFFAALGRSTSAYLAAKGVRDSEESISSLLRCVVLTKCIPSCWSLSPELLFTEQQIVFLLIY